LGNIQFIHDYKSIDRFFTITELNFLLFFFLLKKDTLSTTVRVSVSNFS